MAYEGSITVPSGFRPVHSFDLWGVIVDQCVLGQHKIDIYKKIALENKIPDHEVKRVVHDYQAVLSGEPWATGSMKSKIIDAISSARVIKETMRYYASAFLQDALDVMQEIIDAGEWLIIFTSDPAPGLQDQFPSSIAERISAIRYGEKTNPEAFKAVFKSEEQLAHRIVTHTADELPELIAAKESGLFQAGGLIYINRNDSNSESDVRNEGIDHFVNDLCDVQYTALVKKRRSFQGKLLRIPRK